MNTYYIIITNCTARKRQGIKSLEMSSSLAGQDIVETAHQWKSAVNKHEPKFQARELYQGRSMQDAKHVARLLEAPLYIASAGLGFVEATENVAPYNLSPSNPHGGLQSALVRCNATPSQWWDVLCNGRGLSTLLSLHREATLLVALPANYVSMLANDFLKIAPSDLKRIRLFTSKLGARALTGKYHEIVMPYDERLESVPKSAGTRSDYPQRAMRHFVEVLHAHSLPIKHARAKVQESLAPFSAPSTVDRRRVDDESIKALIRQEWHAKDGRGSSLLRHLRDEVLISCEQGRFAKLWREVGDELAH